MPNIGPTELIIVLIIALVILGPKRLPSAGRSLGQGLREFRDAIAGHGDARAAGSLAPALDAAAPEIEAREGHSTARAGVNPHHDAC
jgi:sec-independent protein translocase protein TatA